MEKRKNISIAWFLFFAALGSLLFNWWRTIAFILAGLTIARWVTSRIKIKLFYATWLIFPVLSLMFINSIGDRAAGWCEKNSPSVLFDNTVHCIKEISNGKSPEIIRNLIDQSPEEKQELINKTKDKIKTSFLESISALKDLTKHLSKQLFKEPTALMDNS